MEQLLLQMLSPNNDERKRAEEAYNNLMNQQPSQFLSLLFAIGTSHGANHTREQAFVLLRRAITGNIYEKIDDATKQAVKNGLFSALEREGSTHALSTIADAIAELGGQICEQGGWPELLPTLFNLTKSPNEALRTAALEIFSGLATSITAVLVPHLPVLKHVFATGLADPSLSVKLAAFQAAARMIESLQKPRERNIFQDLTPSMLGVLATALNENKEDEAANAITTFIEVAEIEPAFLRPNIQSIVNAMMQIASTQELDENVRHLGLECLVTLTTVRPGMMKKVPEFTQRLIPIVLNMMVDLEENPKWNLGDEEDLEDTNCNIGEESLDRLAIALGGQTIVPIIVNMINQLLASPDWRHRHAAMMSISIIGEGCEATLRPHLRDVINLVLPRFSDPHERVRWAACNTAGQLSTDFGPQLQQQFHSEILPAYVRLMDDLQNPRVQSHAASAIVNWCEHCTPEILKPYLHDLLGKLIQLLQQGKRIVQEQAVTAVAAIAECVEAEFGPYYNTFMPMMKTILEQAVGKEYRTLRGKAMECISLIGVAVGKEVFLEDAKIIMQLLSQSQGTLDPDDPQVEYMFQAWTRICKCLGDAFVPYLPVVMPSLLQAAQLAPALRISEEGEDFDEEGWDYIDVGGTNVGIKTSFLEDKNTAVTMLMCFVDELKEGFFPYVEEVAKLMLPLLKFYYHDGVRTAAIQSLAPLLICVDRHLQKNGLPKNLLIELWGAIFNALVVALPAEPVPEVSNDLVEAWQECIDALGPNSCTPEQLETSFNLAKTLITELFNQRAEREDKREDLELEDDEEMEDEGEREQEFLGAVADVVGKLARTHHEQILPYFGNHILPLVYKLLSSTESRDRQVAICIFDDIAEHTGPTAYPLWDSFLPVLVQSITDADAAVRQAAVYGIGVCVSLNPEKLSPMLQEITNRLAQIIGGIGSRDEENIYATENAISALGKVIKTTNFKANELLPLWLSYLPTSADKVEAVVINNMLCDFVERDQFRPHLLGEGGLRNLPKLVSVFGEVLETELVDEATTTRIKNILRSLFSTLPPETFASIAGTLTDEQRAKLQRASS